MPEPKEFSSSDSRDIKPSIKEFVYSSTPGREDDAQRDFEAFVRQNLPLVDEEVLNKLSLGFREIFVNALYHGNLEIQGKKAAELHEVAQNSPLLSLNRKVAVKLSATLESLEVVITDEGKGFNLQAVADPTSEGGLLEPSGRGILLAKEFYDQVDFEPNQPQGTKVTLRKKIQN